MTEAPSIEELADQVQFFEDLELPSPRVLRFRLPPPSGSEANVRAGTQAWKNHIRTLFGAPREGALPTTNRKER